MLILLWSLVISIVFMTLVYLYAMHKKDNSIVDVAWGLAFALIALFTFSYGIRGIPQTAVTVCVLAWGCRLSLHILLRRKGEDFRYKAWRARWGKWFALRSYFQIFFLQGVLAVVIIWPVIMINTGIALTLTTLAWVGLLIWLVGFAWETVADAQLVAFKADKKSKGKIMTRGLWKYSRHPNYFGEALLWWGIGLAAYGLTRSWWAFLGPAVLTYSLLRVSGVPMLEAKWAKHKEYQSYSRKTNAFFPWPPRK